MCGALAGYRLNRWKIASQRAMKANGGSSSMGFRLRAVVSHALTAKQKRAAAPIDLNAKNKVRLR